MSEPDRLMERRVRSRRSPRSILRTRVAAGLVVSCVLAPSGGAARAGEILGVLDRTTGILVPTAPPVAPASAAASASATRLGTFKIVCTFTFGPEIPTSTAVDESVSIATSDATFNNQVLTTGTLKRSGNTQTVTLYLPYYWTVASAGETVAIYFDANTAASGGYFDFSRSFTVKLPANGAQTPLTFGGAL